MRISTAKACRPHPAILFGLAFSLFGCAPDQDNETIQLGEKFTTRLEQNHVTPDQDFAFNISEIIRDIRVRCPKNVSCVWEGEIVVKIEYFTSLEKIQYRDIRTLGFGSSQIENFGDYSLRIHEFSSPRPPAEYDKYRFTVEVKRINLD